MSNNCAKGICVHKVQVGQQEQRKTNANLGDQTIYSRVAVWYAYKFVISMY